MSYGLTDFGEEFMIRKCFLENLGTISGISIGLYDDSTDNIGETDDLGAITTEPSGVAYSRISKSFGTTDFTGQQPSDDVQAIIGDHTFDLSDDTTGSVDSYFIVITFQSSIVGSDGAQTDHLVATGSLAQSYDLSMVDSLDNNGAGIGQD